MSAGGSTSGIKITQNSNQDINTDGQVHYPSSGARVRSTHGRKSGLSSRQKREIPELHVQVSPLHRLPVQCRLTILLRRQSGILCIRRGIERISVIKNHIKKVLLTTLLQAMGRPNHSDRPPAVLKCADPIACFRQLALYASCHYGHHTTSHFPSGRDRL